MRRNSLIFLLIFASIAACAGPEHAFIPPKPAPRPQIEAPVTPPPVPAKPALARLDPGDYPDFSDSCEPFSLASACAGSIDYLSKLPRKRVIKFGPDGYSASRMADSLKDFREFLLSGPSAMLVRKYISERFNVYASTGSDGSGRVLFTGYYCPEIEARPLPDDTFKYPLYKKPDDLIFADLGQFKGKLKGEKVLGRVENGKFVPYHARRDIREGALDNRGLEIAWCRDPVDIFFMQIQGSGVLVFPDGTKKHVNYAGANGRAYKGIGGIMAEKCRAEGGTMSLDWLKNYLRTHPDEADDLMDKDDSYVFFTLADNGPFGCLGEPVTDGRSIAVDNSVFPPGALAFVDTEAPEVTDAGAFSGWAAFRRFMFAQDTGGAIKGPGRVDIYFGYGGDAGEKAGYMKRNGRLYFLAGKEALLK